MVQRMGEIEMVDFRYETIRSWAVGSGDGHLLRGRGRGLEGRVPVPSGRGERERTVTQLEFRDAGLMRCVGAKANCGLMMATG